ncbi:helix-turn-helix transcriptional regulator [Streptomyces sp. NRRL S-15]|uniref:helix-turn-helix transcriptional regulator n=1 Tax=Streptomyces sp. NRRL S-15 TaxID=1463886 RepID=UPI0004C5FBF6|nr:LuxR family transcriptional regulator [Streptomyces sp. NRRL S-15]
MRLVERDEHVRYLDGLLEECRGRRGHVVVLDGPVTTGKTELLRVFTERASSDVVVLRATCSRAERTLPLGVVTQLLHSAGLPLDIADRAAQLLKEGAASDALSRTRPDTVEPEAVRIFQGLGVVLLDLAAKTPVLIAVDDVQHADEASLHCLLHIVRRIGSARILAVLTEDAELGAQHSPFRAELRRQSQFHRLRLAPLTRAGVAEVLRGRHSGHSFEPEETAPPQPPEGRPALWDVDDFFRISGGNPLLLHALIEDHDIAGEVRAQGYGLALLNCLYRDKPAIAHVARALAVLDEEGAVEELAQLAGADTEAVCRALHDMEAAGLTDNGVFRHPVARSTILDGLQAPDRAALHRRAAQLMHARGAPAMTVAHHLVESKHTQGPWAVRVLLEAADQALLGGRTRLATECLALAHRSCGDEHERPGIRARLAQAEWELNPAAAARHLTPLAAASANGQLGHGDLLVLLRHLLWHGRTGEAKAVLERIRGARPETDGTPQAAPARNTELWLAATHPQLARRHQGPVPSDDGSPTFADPRGDPWLRSAAELAGLLAHGPGEPAADRAERVLDGLGLGLGRTSPWTEEAVQLALLVLISVGRLRSADGQCVNLLAEAGPREAPVWTAMASATRAEIAVRQGDLAAGAVHARQALTQLPPQAWGVAIGFPLGSLILAVTRMGDYEEAAKHLTFSATDAMFRSRYGLHYLHARGHYYLATDHPHAALADFLSCGELLRTWGLDAAALIPWRTGAAEAWLRLGNRDQAKRLLHDQLAGAGRDRMRIRGSALRLLAATGPAARRPELLSEALDLLEDCGDRYEQARALVDLSRSHHQLEEYRRARMVSRRAWHVAGLCDAGPLTKELLAATGDLNGPDTASGSIDGIPSLTGSERRVASLAVMGCTNREIASKLHITASTVEQHLTRVYRKLKVKRRKDLPVDLRSDVVKTERAQLDCG